MRRRAATHLKTSVWTFLITFFALSVTMPAGVTAQPGLCTGPKNERPPECDEGGDADNGASPATNPTIVRWQGAIDETDFRDCLAQNVKPNGDHGFYACQLGSPGVFYDLGGLDFVQTARHGDAALCSAFDGLSLQPDAKYVYDWLDNCHDDGHCTVRILNWFSEPQMSALLPGVGLTTLAAYAEAMPGDDLNPFAVDQMLNIDRIEIRFSGEGKNKTLATCQADLPFGIVRFESVPVF